MQPIIQVRNISKSYKIGSKEKRYLSLRDSLLNMGKNLFTAQKEEFWALKDVSFDVMPGECIGIIGGNGAGKSTLLKILSKITPPTKGEIVMRGRVASLLEVGTGFHPELTGRENIYLNGAILGMKHSEINAQFDEIVDFSGVEQFLDTPLKHYSSGMQLRLAFSVAAHLNPEILLIDEVLAVGDTEFQKKCLGKMDEVSKSGRTVVFVSHDLGAVRKLCKKSILIESGEITKVDDTDKVIRIYESNLLNSPSYISKCLNSKLKIDQFKIYNTKIHTLSDLHFSCSIVTEKKNTYHEICLLIYNSQKKRVGIIDLRLFGKNGWNNTSSITIEGVINKLPLIPDTYSFGFFINSSLVEADFFDIFYFKVEKHRTLPVSLYPQSTKGFIAFDAQVNTF